MLWFETPKRASYLEAITETDIKWWVGAEDSSGRLITAWSQRPDSPHIVAQLRAGTGTGILDVKIVDKHKNGYTELSRFSGHPYGSWSPYGVVPAKHTIPMEVPYDMRPREEQFGSIRLSGRTDIVRLELFKSEGSDNNFRLDQYEHHHSDVGSFTTWQTVYNCAEAAVEAIEAVIANRTQKYGYQVDVKDLSGLTAFRASTLPPVCIFVPGKGGIIQPIVWDF